MTGPLRFALIGCGAIGPALAEGAAEATDVELSACVDLVAKNARELANEYDVDDWFTDHDAMLETTDPDVAIVATPSGTHASIVVDCADAGVHVLCQKPLEVAVDSMDAMVEACESNGVTFGGLFNTRFGRGPRRAKRLVETGALGDIVLANGVLPAFRGQDYYDSADWRGTYEMDGGCLMNQGIHTVDRLAWFTNGIERVFADVDTIAHEMEAEDVAAVQLRFGNGARGTLSATTAVRNVPDYDRIDIYGEQGYLSVTPDRITELETDAETDVDVEPIEMSGFGVQIQDMAEAIREDRDPVITGREARHAPNAVLAMYEAARRDEPLHVQKFLEQRRDE